MIRRVPAIVAGAAGLVVLAGAVSGGIVFAATSDTPPTPSTQNGTPPNPGDRQQRLDDYLNRLAQNLGVSVDKLKGALKDTAKQEIDKAVADGKLTADQAQKLKDALDSGTNVPLGPGFGGRMPGGRGPGGMAPNGTAPNGTAPNGQARPMGPGGFGGIMGIIPGATNEIAGFLNITPEQLRQDLQNGQSLSDLAKAAGKTTDQLKSFLTDEATKQIDAMVASGKITQDQGAKMKQAFTGNLDPVINGKLPQGGMPFAGPRHGGARPNGQNQQTPSQSGGSGASLRATS